MKASTSAARLVGLITYMRTDGVDMAPEAIQAARRVIAKEYGDRYLPGVPRKYTTKAKNAQEAHEAIRPTDMGRLPKQVARYLDAGAGPPLRADLDPDRREPDGICQNSNARPPISQRRSARAGSTFAPPARS